MHVMKILVTGFEPFGGETVNPALEAVRKLPSAIGCHQIVPLQIPVVRYEALRIIAAKIEEVHPDAVISIGQAGGRKALSFERVGINCDDYPSFGDNAHNTPVDEAIYADGPDAYFTTLPVRKMMEACRAAGVEAEISNSAGTYVCNHVLYGVRNYCSENHPGIISGFIHVPFLPEQTKNKEKKYPSMPLEDIVKGITAAIAVLDREEE